jgi:hypothetical protein
MHTLREIGLWLQDRDGLVWGLGHEPLTRPLRAPRAKSRFWRIR